MRRTDWGEAMRILADRTEIKRSQQAFKKAVSSAATNQVSTRIGQQGWHRDARVYWIASVGLWAYFDFQSPGKRYWTAFGLGKPNNAVSITCEINPRSVELTIASRGHSADMGETSTFCIGATSLPVGKSRRFSCVTILTILAVDRSLRAMVIGIC